MACWEQYNFWPVCFSFEFSFLMRVGTYLLVITDAVRAAKVAQADVFRVTGADIIPIHVETGSFPRRGSSPLLPQGAEVYVLVFVFLC